MQSRKLLELKTSNAQVTALLNALPEPLPAGHDRQAAMHMYEQIRQLQPSYLLRLQQFWTQPHCATAGQPADQWLALTLKSQLRIEAQLRSLDGTLTADDRQLIDQVLNHPTRAQRESTLPMLPTVYRPGVYGIAFLRENASDTTPWPGAYVICSRDGAVLQGRDPDPKHFKGKTTVDIKSDLGRAILYSLESGLETFASLKHLHTTLQARIGQAIAQRFSACDDKNESLFAWQVRALRGLQQKRLADTFANLEPDTPEALLARIKAAADLRDVLDTGPRESDRLQTLEYKTWQQTFKDASRPDWQRYRTLAWQVQTGQLALALALTKAAQAIAGTWQYANAARLQLAALEARLHGRIGARRRQWIEVLLDYPDPATRPTLGGHAIIANALGLHAPPQDPQDAMPIISGGVLAITSADPSDTGVVLYTPDSPGCGSLEEFGQLHELDQRALEPAWTDYFAARLSPSGNAAARLLKPGTRVRFQRVPIPGNLHQSLYEVQRDRLIEQARHNLSDTTGLTAMPALTPEPPPWKTAPAPQPANGGFGATRLRLLGGAPQRPSAIAGLVRLGSWNPQVMDIVPPLMTNLPDWPQGSNLVIIDSREPGFGWSVRYRPGLREDTYGYRVNPDMFSARHDVVLYRSSPNHYRVRLNGNSVDVPAGEDSFFHAVAQALNQGHEAATFTVERLRNAVADHIERNPQVVPFVTAEYLPLYARALEHCTELNIWLGDDVFRELTAILKGTPNPYGLFQPAIRYLDATLPSHLPRLGNAVDQVFNSVYETHGLRALPAEIREIIDGYIDAAPRPTLSLLVDRANRRALLETLLVGPSQAADIDYLVDRTFLFDHNIRHMTLEYGVTAAQLRQYATQHAGNQITARRDLLRAVIERFPALLERLDIIFSSATLTPPMGDGLNVNQIANLLRDPHISTTRLRLIARCADAGIVRINLLDNADTIRSLSDEVVYQLLEHRQQLQALAVHMGPQDIRSMLIPFEVQTYSWNPHQFQSAALANARLKLLLDTPRLFNLLRQRSGRVAANMWRRLTSAIFDEARVRRALADPRQALGSLLRLDMALSEELPSTSAQAASATPTRPQPAYLRGYELPGGSTPALSGPDARGFYQAPDGKLCIVYEGLHYEVRSFGNRIRIVHAIDGFRRVTYEVRRRADGTWQLMDAPGLGGDVRRPRPSIAEQSRAQRDEFASLGQAAQQEWQQLGADPAVSTRVADLNAIEATPNGYTMPLIDANGAPQQHLTLEKSSALARLSTRIRATISAVHQHFAFENGQLLPRPGVTHHEVIHGLAQLDGLNSLNTGFALLLLSSAKHSALSAELASAVQVQFQTQLALVIIGVAIDAKILAQAIYLGLKDAGHLGTETIRLLDKAGRGITLGSKTLTLGGLLAAGSALLVLASLGLDSYLLAHARTAEDKAVYGTNVGLDSLALGTVLAGFAEGAEFLGPLSIPLAGLGLGVSSLVSVFFAKAHKVLATGEHFTREIQAYRSGYVEDPETHGLQMSGPVIVTHLDQRNGQVYLGSPKIYAVDNSHSGDPQVIVDERQAIDVGQVLELPRQMTLPVSNTARALYLPATPEHSYLPQYAWLVGATQRNDAQLQLFKVLEQKTQGRFIEAEWIAVFQKVVEKLLPRYHPTRIRVSLGLEAPPLVMDALGELGQYLSYDIEGQGSRYDLYLNEGARLNLSSCTTSRPSTWVLHSDHLSRPEDIRFEAGRLTIGGVVVQVEDKATVYVVNRASEAYRLDPAAGRYTLVTLAAGDYENVGALVQHLQALRGRQRLDASVHIEDLSTPDHPGRGIYYRPADGGFVAIPVDGEDHGQELYQIPLPGEALVILPSPQREKIQEAAATLAAMRVYMNAQYQQFGGRSAGFWSAHPAEGLPGNEKFYGDFLRAQYRLEVQRARLHSSGYADSACQMMLQLLPDPERDRSSQGKRLVAVHRLNINGYPADDVLILGDPRQGTLLLYVPESKPALTVCNGVSDLKACVQRLAAADATRQALREHFPRRYRASNHSALWGYMGTDEALEKIGDSGDWSLIQIDRSPIADEDVFAALASLKRRSEGG
ncbi:TcdA/TcdB pore-forming domain-containing protein [Pseudomonas sp. MWU13-2105]|uniref:TcdA/TcdB pore-forming domain-containing protein n=1 Tax=Pseudomonas sp. MWU13-2105 TaxID=2935074 RepID=UPI00200D0246|nr:TcdA/TcdB pore-forming domain-containing protein [Pseudomonas sp. MWU13-2105]